jgi:hypothetical protein
MKKYPHICVIANRIVRGSKYSYFRDLVRVTQAGLLTPNEVRGEAFVCPHWLAS